MKKIRSALAGTALSVALVAGGLGLAAPANAAMVSGCRVDEMRYDHGILVLWQRNCFVDYSAYETRNYGFKDGRRYSLCKWPLSWSTPACTAFRKKPYFVYYT